MPDDIVALLSACVLRPGVTKNILECLPPDERNRLGSPSRIEAQLLDLWIVNETLSRSQIGLSATLVQALIDENHSSVYVHLASTGYTDAALTELQNRIRSRYKAYGEALTPVLSGDPTGAFRLSSMVVGNLFKIETNDPAIVMAVTGRLTAALFSTNDLLVDAVANVDWR